MSVCLSVGQSVTVVTLQKRLNRSRCRLGCGLMGCTSAQSGEYDWTVCVRRRSGLMSNDYDHLFVQPEIPVMKLNAIVSTL